MTAWGVWRRSGHAGSVGHFFEGVTSNRADAIVYRGVDPRVTALCGRFVLLGLWAPRYLERCVDCATKVRKRASAERRASR